MPIALMSDKRQLEIVEAVKVAADLVADGKTPTEAIVKAAGDLKANEHELRRMTEAYNTSATLAHMRTSNEKAASFPLADFDAAKLELFPVGEKSKIARSVKQARAFDIPDLRTEKVAGFYGDLGTKYKVLKGEHKDSKGVLVAYDTDDTEEKSLDGKTVTTKRTENYSATLKIGDKEVTFSNPEAELRREYDSDGSSMPSDAKVSSVKVADIGSCFYGNPGEIYKVISGEHKGCKGTLKSCKTTRRETNKIDGATKTTSRTNTASLVLTIKGESVTVSGNDVERDYGEKEASMKTAGDRNDILGDYLAWGMSHGSRFPTGMVTPEVIEADAQYQNYKKAQATKTAKVAAAQEVSGPLRDMDSLVAHALRECGHWQKVAGENRQGYQEHRGIAMTAMYKLAEVFRRAQRPDWGQFESEALAVDVGSKDYLNAVYNTGSLASVKCARATEPSRAAYIDTKTELHKLFSIFKTAAEIAAEYKFNEKVALERYETDRAEILAHTKFGGMMMTGMNPMLVAAQLAGTFDNTMPPAAPAKASLNPNVGLESELNKARLQAAVKEMMTDDDVIAQHAGQDPAKIMKIIEQLSQVHPKILEMPSVLQSGVRKALELGSIEPFELKQLQSLGEPTAPAPTPAQG